MNQLTLHTITQRVTANFLAHPSHALLLTAPPGAGKRALAHYLASELLGISETDLAAYPYFKLVNSSSGKAISVDEVRAIVRFMSRRTASEAAGTSRIVIVEDSHLMTVQAQNALLKTIEEPPADTVLILTASDELSLLPTIRSRVQRIVVQAPDQAALKTHFSTSYDASLVDRTLLMSGGLPGLMHAMLVHDTTHPLVEASSTVRSILQKTTFERLALVDELAKDRQQTLNILYIMERMAELALRQADKGTAHLRRWQKILTACHQATEQLMANAQPKLALTNFMLDL